MWQRDMWQPLTAERLRNLNEEYTTFLYGFDAVGGGAVASDLATNQVRLWGCLTCGHGGQLNVFCWRPAHARCQSQRSIFAGMCDKLLMLLLPPTQAGLFQTAELGRVFFRSVFWLSAVG